MTPQRLDQMCEWMRQSQRWARIVAERIKRVGSTVKGRARIAAQRRRQAARARAIWRQGTAQNGRGWYDPRADFWTLSAECPVWADEMRRVLRRLTPYQRRRR